MSDYDEVFLAVLELLHLKFNIEKAKGKSGDITIRIWPQDAKDQNLKIFLTIVNSLLVEKGLFLGIDYVFDPYSFNFNEISDLVFKYDEFILKELGIGIKTEV